MAGAFYQSFAFRHGGDLSRRTAMRKDTRNLFWRSGFDGKVAESAVAQ
jgi:hypothetical protein